MLIYFLVVGRDNFKIFKDAVIFDRLKHNRNVNIIQFIGLRLYMNDDEYRVGICSSDKENHNMRMLPFQSAFVLPHFVAKTC